MKQPTAYIYSSNVDSKAGFQNRGFKYADGFFETMKIVNGEIKWQSSHERRIARSLEQLSLVGTRPEMSLFVTELAAQWGVSKNELNARFRVTFFRNGKGGYTPEGSNYSWVGEGEWLEDNTYSFGVKGLQTKIYEEHPKLAGSGLSNIKSLASLFYVQAGLWAAKRQLREVVLLNHHGRVCEGLQSNIFLVKQGCIITPSLPEGPVRGIMREQVISWCELLNIPMEERAVHVEELTVADEVFFTNSIRGIQWCVGMGDVRYKTKLAKALYQQFLAE